MRALMLTAYGLPPKTELGELSDPQPRAGEVRIRVRAAGLNPIDAKIAAGYMAEVMPLELPAGVGSDAAGIVDVVGDGVQRYTVGDAVMGMFTAAGSIADYVIAPADSVALAHKPAGVSFLTASVAPMVGLTAATIVRAARPARTAAVLGASGGVGRFLLPALRDLGVDVLATGRSDDASRLQQAGASAVVDYRENSVEDAARQHFPDGADLVIDMVNQLDALPASARLLRPGGQLISTLVGPDPSAFGDAVVVTYIRNTPANGDLNGVAEALAQGAVALQADEVAPFAEAVDAFTRYTTAAVSRKVAIVVDDSTLA